MFYAIKESDKMSTSEDATEQKKSEDRPRSSRFRQTSAHIDHLSVGKYDKFRGTTSTISTFEQKIQKKNEAKSEANAHQYQMSCIWAASVSVSQFCCGTNQLSRD